MDKNIKESRKEKGEQDKKFKDSEKNREIQSLLSSHKTRIKVVGCGGAGNNTITRMVEIGISGVQTITLNTDAQDLLYAEADEKILIGKEITNGLGAGSDPEVGERSARETEAEITELLKNSDLVFVTCGLGGGTGTGSAPVVAEIAKKQNALTISVVTVPFADEGILRFENARIGLEKLEKNSDTVIVVQNEKLLEIVPDMPLNQAFKVSDEILVNAVKGITELVTEKGLVNLDFADIRAVMRDGGTAMIGLGESDGDNKALEAVKMAVQNPLLDVDIVGARSALINITGGNDMSLKDARQIMQAVAERLDPSARVIWGARMDPALEKTLRVMLIVTGLKTTSSDRKPSAVTTKKVENIAPVPEPVVKKEPEIQQADEKLVKIEKMEQEVPREPVLPQDNYEKDVEELENGVQIENEKPPEIVKEVPVDPMIERVVDEKINEPDDLGAEAPLDADLGDDYELDDLEEENIENVLGEMLDEKLDVDLPDNFETEMEPNFVDDINEKSVFNRIFEEETEADLAIFDKAVTKLVKGVESDKSLSEIRNSASALSNSAHLFAFNHIASFAESVEALAKKLQQQKLPLEENLVALFEKSAAILRGMVYNEQEAVNDSFDLIEKISDKLQVDYLGPSTHIYGEDHDTHGEYRVDAEKNLNMDIMVEKGLKKGKVGEMVNYVKHLLGNEENLDQENN